MSRPVGHSLIPYGTPLHVTQMVLALLRATFADLGGENYPYRFTQDFETTGVIIDKTFNKESGAYGIKPALVVARGQVSGQQVATGDLAGQAVKTGNTVRTNLVRSAVTINCISKSETEADILGMQVFNFLGMCRNVFPSLLGLHRAEPPILSTVSPMEKDDKMYVATASMEYSMQYKWTHVVPQEILNNIDLYINQDLVFTSSNP